MNKKFKKTLNNILNVITTIMIVILFFGIVSNFQTNFMGKKYNSFFGHTLFEIKTASMAGYTEIGDWILVKETKNVKLNDVITFEENGSFITHRVIQIYNDTYITKGDSNNSEDIPVTSDQIVGIVVKVLPKFAYIKKTLLNTKVIILLLVTIVLGNSLFTKEENDVDLISRVKNIFSSKKKTPNNDKPIIVYKDMNDIKSDSKESILNKYPSLNQLEEVNDCSKTIALSKIVVNKSKTVNEMKELLNENNSNSDKINYSEMNNKNNEIKENNNVFDIIEL